MPQYTRKDWLEKIQAEAKKRHSGNAVSMEMKVVAKKEKRFIPDAPFEPIVRPPAEYSNKSPYGIATELLMQQLKSA